MKREASVCGFLPKALLCARRMITVAIVTPVFFFSVAATAQNGGLGFHGELVNTGCDVVQASGTGSGSNVRYVQVSGMTLQMTTGRSACADKEVPFTMQYQALYTAPLPIATEGQSRAGVLTLTYH